MVSADLINTVRNILQRTSRPLLGRELADLLNANRYRAADFEVREAVWILIDNGEVEFTPDRKFRFIKDLG